MTKRTGDPFRAFYDRALPAVYGYLLTRLGDESRAARAAREAFEAIVEQWPLPANVKYEVAFAIGFARSKLVEDYRRQDQQTKRRRQFAVTSAAAAAHRTTAAANIRVHWALKAIPATQRAALVLRQVDDLSLREVAGIIGRGQRVTEFLLARGARTLHREFKQAERADGFDPLAAMKGLDGPVKPPETFHEELYDELRARLDQSAVGAPRPEAPPGEAPQKVFLVAAIVLAAILLLTGVLSRSGSSGGTGSTVAPLPLSEPDPPEHNPDPAVISPSISPAPVFEPIRPPTRSLGGYQFGGWTVLPASDFDGRRGAAVAWTGEQLVVWGGELSGSPAERGGILNPGVDVWFSMPPAPIAPRSGATALWTGTEVLILGGDRPDGAAYDPATRLWRELPSAPIPAAPDDVAVWTGTEVLLFGGWGAGGHAFDVAEDSWRRIANAPELEWENAGGVWTGTEMIVWGDPVQAFGDVGNVAAYDPVADSWRLVGRTRIDGLMPSGEPIGLADATGVWTGEEVILWGVDIAGGGDAEADWAYAGFAVNPVTSEWRAIAPPPSPDIDSFWVSTPESVAWTGSRMLVWHQNATSDGLSPEIWSYDPVADVWERGASSPVASNPSLIWTGDTLYAYGGGNRLFRTLSLDLGPGGDVLPDPVGTEVVTYAHPPLPFELLTVAANSRRAAVIDFEDGIATVYESPDNLLPPDGVDGATPAGSGWVTSANGAVWSYPNGIASQPFVLQGANSVPAAPTIPASRARCRATTGG